VTAEIAYPPAQPGTAITSGPNPESTSGSASELVPRAISILEECHATKRHLRARTPVILRTARVVLNGEEVAMRPESCQAGDMVGPKVVKQDSQFHSSGLGRRDAADKGS
jgi:hypothetical protein